MNDYHLHNRPKLMSYVQKERTKGETILIKPLGPGHNPGLANEGIGVILNNYYLRVDHPKYPDDRLVVVLYHELGHMHYFRAVSEEHRTPEESEYCAFENSLKECRSIALDMDDPHPLKTVLHCIDLRRNSGSEQPHYQAAIDRIVASRLWEDCKRIVEPTAAADG